MGPFLPYGSSRKLAGGNRVRLGIFGLPLSSASLRSIMKYSEIH